MSNEFCRGVNTDTGFVAAEGNGMALEAFIVTFGYLGIFLLVLVMNMIPFFMPPTWIVLSTLYFLFPQQFDPFLLALIGAFASTFGRAVLCRIGAASRGFMGENRKKGLDIAGQALRSKKYGGFLLSFLFALSPLPSNVFFLTMGTMRCNFFTIFLGFWFGRLISYAVTINVAHIGFSSLADVLASQIQAVVLVDSLGIISMIVFAFVDWERLIRERRITFIKPKLWNAR